MNKRFLLQVLGLLCAVSSFALNYGDYVYTPTARFKVTGDNIIANGSFENQDVTSAGFGWYANASQGNVGTDYWSIEPGAGPNGETVLQSVSTDENATLWQSVPYDATKSYIITFKIKGPESTMSSVQSGQLDFINVYASEDGSATVIEKGQVATAEVIGTEWTEINYSFTDPVEGGKAGFLVVEMARLAYGTQVTGFEIREVNPVYDDRIAKREIDYCKMLVNSGEFADGVDDFKGTLDYMDELLADPAQSEDVGTMESLLEALTEECNTFLDKNSADVMSYISRGLITSWTKFNNGDGTTTHGDWVFDGKDKRWGHADGADFANYSFPSAYNLGWGTATIVKSGMKAGRYMFSAEATATHYVKSGSDNYASDYSTTALDGFKVFVGKDSVNYGVLDNRNFNTYVAFGNIAEGEDLTAGLYFPGFESGGGVFKFRSRALRILGVSADELARAKFVADINAQQVELLKRINLAKEDLTGTWPWGRKDLQDSITVAEERYNASLVYVSADGQDLGMDIPEDYDDVVLEAVRSMNSARNAFSTINVPYKNLVDYVAVAQTSFDNEANAGALASAREALKAAIESANALIAGVTEEPQAEAFEAQLAALQQAVTTFELSTASYENPTDLVIKNADFRQNGGQKSGKCEGWDLTLQSDSKGWFFFGEDKNFEMGYRIYVSRGNTAFSQNKAIQKITVNQKGLYAFKTQAYAVNSAQKNYNAMWNGMSGEDSLRISGIALFFGPENNPDSVDVCTYQETFGNNVWDYDELRHYTIFYDKKTEGEEVLEFGMDGLANGVPMGAGCNLYGFGSNHIYYFGDTDRYHNGIENVNNAATATEDTAVYTLTGIKVADKAVALPKGVYISGGKKFVVK